jgi:hypothetical protein
VSFRGREFHGFLLRREGHQCVDRWRRMLVPGALEGPDLERTTGLEHQAPDRLIRHQPGEPVSGVGVGPVRSQDNGRPQISEPSEQVLDVVKQCFEAMSADCDRVTCSAKFDYRKGYRGRLDSKVKSVEEKVGRPLKTT